MMSTIDENKVIEAVKQGFIAGFMPFTPAMEDLMRQVYRAGYKQRQIEEMEERLKSLTGDDNGATTMV